MKKTIIFLLMTVFVPAILTAGTTPYQFLRYNSSARSAGLANCFVSMTGDPSGVFFNPATISTVTDKHFSATFLKHILDINSGNVSYIKNFENIGTTAASVAYTSYGSFDYADRYGARNGTFSANDLLFSVTYSNRLDTNLYYGASLKFLYANIEKYYSTALAVDAGIIYQLPQYRTNIGFSVLHAGMQLSKFQEVSESLPLDIRLGVNNRLKGLPLLVNLSFHHLADDVDNFFERFLNFSVAGELYIGQYIDVRLGYDNNVRQMTTIENDRGFSGISGGLGIKTKYFNFDYGLAINGTAALLHRFTIGMEF